MQKLRPSSQPKQLSQQDKMSTNLNNLKLSLQQSKEQSRWSKINNESNQDNQLLEFLKSINLHQYYTQISQLCNDNLKNLIYIKQLNLNTLPAGHQLKLIKAIQKLQSNIQQKQQDKEVEHQINNEITKQCCWNCYRIIIAGFSYDNRDFCTLQCLNTYKQELLVNCQRCNQQIIKYQAINSYGKWYCQEKCVFSQEELLINLIRTQRETN